ncbi:MAG TPA: DNA-3-methyladenine glycosylase I [Anaeromyxobacteraceae bacterium]|nr:DNA-3-methyladenine glycosylase I [Anaeromyxobacteraceae bacterium]
MSHGVQRCPWAARDPLYVAYHDQEWGVPLRDDGALFELLVLEGFQAGLSWITILRKREAFRCAFNGFDPEAVARYGGARVETLLRNPSIIRHRGKIEGAVQSARAFLALRDQGVGLASYAWGFVEGLPINRWRRVSEVPAETQESRALSAGLRSRGFAFVGPKTCYAFMQSAGMVNDHLVGCFRHAQLTRRSMPLKRAGRMKSR